MGPYEFRFAQRKHLWIAGILILAILSFSMMVHEPHARTMLVRGDNDDIMRWMSIKAWLGGQSWFDMTQYRVEPPEGLSMHWSRYLDAAIGGLYSLLTLQLAPDAAERWTFVLWPNLLLLILLFLTAKSTERLLGPLAAIFAVATIMTWMPIRGITFANGRIDHHNLQILLTSAMAMAMILPGRAWVLGVASGLTAGFSLAIGLETLAFVATGGLILVMRAAFDAQGGTQRLIGFCLALLGGAVMFHVGQTAPAHWLVAHCDALATPTLAIILIAALSSLAPLALYRRVRKPALRLCAVAALAVLGMWVFSGLLKPCLAGPYGMLPPEAQDFITSRISEALPGLVFAGIRPLTFANVLLPIFVVTVLATAFWLQARIRGAKDSNAAVGQMLVFAWLGLAGSFVQVRLNIIAAPALPFLAGYVGSELTQRFLDKRRVVTLALVLAPGVMVFAVQTLNEPALSLTNHLTGRDLSAQIERPSFDHGCRNEKTLAHLDTLPKAQMLTTLNLGAPLIMVTGHDALSVPYQRGAHTFWNGSFPFRSETLMLQAISQSAPDYIVICRLAAYDAEHGFALALKDNRLPDWLTPVPTGSDDLLVLQVLSDKLPPRP